MTIKITVQPGEIPEGLVVVGLLRGGGPDTPPLLIWDEENESHDREHLGVLPVPTLNQGPHLPEITVVRQPHETLEDFQGRVHSVQEWMCAEP